MDVEVIREGVFTSEDDISRLKFLDWNRTPLSPGKTMRSLENWLKGNAKYTVVKAHTYSAPKRDDFPEWHHVGTHEPVAQSYWNWFHHQFEFVPQKELVFSDSPDFWGSITFPPDEISDEENSISFWGDIGKVSVKAFFRSLMQMEPGDLWITLYDESHHLIIEAQFDFFAACSESMRSGFRNASKQNQIKSKSTIQQLKLF